MEQFKKTVLIDLDGVLNEYTGDFNPDIIPRPQKNVKKFLDNITQNFQLILFTTRNKTLAANWLKEYQLDKYFSEITNEKKLSWLIVDDRCVKFEGDYNLLTKQINEFTPWYKITKETYK